MIINDLNVFIHLINTGTYEYEQKNDSMVFTKYNDKYGEKIFVFSVTEDKSGKSKYNWIIEIKDFLLDQFRDLIRKNKKLYNPNNEEENVVINRLIEEPIYDDFKRFYDKYIIKKQIYNFEIYLKLNPLENENYLEDKFLIKNNIALYKKETNFSKLKGIHKCINCGEKEAIKSHVISEFVLKNINKTLNNNVVIKYYPFNNFDCYIDIDCNNPTDLLLATHTTPNEYTAAYLYCSDCDQQPFENEKSGNFFSIQSDNEKIIKILSKRYIDFLNYKHMELKKNINLFDGKIDNKKINYVKNQNKNLKKIIDILPQKKILKEFTYFIEIDYLFPFSSISIIRYNDIINFIYNLSNDNNFNVNKDAYLIVSFLRKKESTVITIHFKNITDYNLNIIETIFYNKKLELINLLQNCFVYTILNESEIFISSDFYNQLRNLNKKKIILTIAGFKNKEYFSKIIEDPKNRCKDKRFILSTLKQYFGILFDNYFESLIINNSNNK